MIQALLILFVGFVRGLEHALEADHVLTVVNLTTRSRNWMKAVGVSLWWGLGHSLTLLVGGLLILSLRIACPFHVGVFFEALVGLTLIFVGWNTLKDCLGKKPHLHAHDHGPDRHLHLHSHERSFSHVHSHDRRAVLIGMIHGLAGTGAMSLLILSTLPSYSLGLLYLTLLGFGTMTGMAFFSGLLSLPFLFTQNRFLKMNRLLHYAAGSLSMFLGFLILGECGWVLHA